MKLYRTPAGMAFDIGNSLLMGLLIVFTLYPCLYVLYASLSDPTLLYNNGKLLLFPVGFNVEGYQLVFKNPMIWIGYKNTLIYVVLGTAINMMMTTLAAYALSRSYLPGKRTLLLLIIFTMYFSGGLIPNFLLVKSLHLYDTIWALVLPGAISTWNLIIMRTYFVGIPESMEESAKVDGANDFIILIRIMIPLAIPIMAVMVLFYSVAHWNSFMGPLIYLNDREKFPIQLILREILIAGSTDSMTAGAQEQAILAESVKYATIIVSTLPIMLVYPFLQKYFVKGIMIGAIKG
ncbi:carbohydrate ABC transporter permease [Paenibacillus chungangensis]|uniref:Carbohydrate ABC transporter permease n=1 Tax=Paenibacillus chungangensis TaxID=696535 RepID=A0ABW3HV16_9BACL